MKKLTKNILKIILLICILGFLFFQFLKSDLNNPFDENKFNQLKADIENSEALSSDFVKVYKKINPIISTNGILVDGFKNSSDYRTCPCLNVARSSFIFSDSRILGNQYVLSWKIEKEFTQMQCLNYYVSNYDFMSQKIGLEQAAVFYFQKKSDELNEEEMSILSLSLRNSALYNPITNLEGIKKKLLELKN